MKVSPIQDEIESLREELRNTIFDQGFHWRILFIGTSVNGSTDIVSSLSRSLRNLGHHVLDIDTRRHNITSNPYRRMGGMGPIFVEHDKIENLLNTFEPQMVICCAGGLTFTDEDAARIKSRGIVLVGITLSDPDVFPTIRDYQHVFDVHTTNAEIALDMYRKAGVHNTVYFPFGIDRGFITQDIPQTSAFDADVICLGHATARPERNSTMSALSEQFDVKTYGRGWDIPDSITVSGIEMVQALQGGKIHVNFPLTRAGYINIKCGVFESASQGRLVATGKFDEMANFFDYEDEIVGYDSTEELAEKIAFLLENPEEYRRIALNGFKRVVTSHLYEHRWMQLFELIKSVDTDSVPGISEARAEEIRRVLSKSFPRAKKIIISGFYGANNLGDEMILRSISQRISTSDPSAQVVVASENPTLVEATHGLQSFYRKAHTVAAYEVKSATAVILGGGGLWHDYTYDRSGGLASFFSGAPISIAGFGILPLMARIIGRPTYAIGLGVGPLSDPEAKQTVKFLAETFESIQVRDRESYKLLGQIGVSYDRVIEGPDSVYAVNLEKIVPVIHPSVQQLIDEGYEIVTLNLRHWRGPLAADIAVRVANALLSLHDNLAGRGRRIAVVAAPMQAGKSHDHSSIDEVFRDLPEDIPTLHMSSLGLLSLEEYIGLLSVSKALIAMRLHAALLAHRSGVPVVGFNYDPKVQRHFEEVERAAFGLELDATSSQIAEALILAFDSGLDSSTRALVSDLERRAVETLDDTVEAITALDPVDAVYSVPSETEIGRGITPVTQTLAAPLLANFAGFKSEVTNNPKQITKGDSFVTARAHEISLALRTERPHSGMAIEQKGVLQLDSLRPTEVRFLLSNNYDNPRAAGVLRVQLTVGNQIYYADPTETGENVEIVFYTSGVARIPVSLRVDVMKSSFRAKSWASATRHLIRIERTTSVSAIPERSMIATDGTVTARKL